MGLNIKNAEIERLAAEVAALANESKTEAIRRALMDRRTRSRRGPAAAVGVGFESISSRASGPSYQLVNSGALFPEKTKTGF